MAETTGNPVDDSFYIERRRDMLEELEIVRLRLEYVRRQYDTRIVYATMDGTISHAMDFAPGRLSQTEYSRQNPLAVIADAPFSIFVVVSREAAMLEVGSRLEMDVGGFMYWTEVIDPAEWGIERPDLTNLAWTEAVLKVEGGILFPARTMGRINAVVAVSRDVLYLPWSAIHTATDGRRFVYVLEDDIRQMRTVETGLEGTLFTEITSGLAMGEAVIL
jgi:hypothetical protein